MKQTKRNNSIKNILYIIGGLIGVNLVILIHEMGHFLLAKIFNVPTPSFSLGFGPALYEFSLGQTVFKLALLPFGGYVEMDPEALANLSYVPKMLIIFAGIAFNLIFAYIVLLYYTIRNQSTPTPVILSIIPHSPADQAGLQPGDIIIACNQQPIDKNIDLITKTTAESAKKTVHLTIERNGTQKEISLDLNVEHPLFGPHTGWLGITLEKKRTGQPSLSNSLQNSHAQLTTTLQSMGRAVSKLITNNNKDQQNRIIGPIGIISMIGKSLAINPQLYWFILAILSLNIGLFNILPLPFFDGGKALVVTIETLTGVTVPVVALWIISTITLALFMIFMTRITISDIKQLLKK